MGHPTCSSIRKIVQLKKIMRWGCRTDDGLVIGAASLFPIVPEKLPIVPDSTKILKKMLFFSHTLTGRTAIMGCPWAYKKRMGGKKHVRSKNESWQIETVTDCSTGMFTDHCKQCTDAYAE